MHQLKFPGLLVSLFIFRAILTQDSYPDKWLELVSLSNNRFQQKNIGPEVQVDHCLHITEKRRSLIKSVINSPLTKIPRSFFENNLAEQSRSNPKIFRIILMTTEPQS